MPYPLKVTNDKLLESYNRLGNIWKVADEVGICGQIRIVGYAHNRPDIVHRHIVHVEILFNGIRCEHGVDIHDGVVGNIDNRLDLTVDDNQIPNIQF